MTEATPPWRRLRTDGLAARLVAFSALSLIVGLICLLVALPLIERTADAQRRADTLDKRTSALRSAAAERRAEADISTPPAAALTEAGAYLNEFAPVRESQAAMLDLLSSLRLIAQAADVRLTAAAPLDLNRSSARVFEMADDAGLTVLAAEARIVSDHAGLMRFLEAVEKASPALRAASLDVTAKTPRADQEVDRLTARIIVGAIIRGGDE